MPRGQDAQDAEDIRRVRAGDAGAFSGLVARHGRRVHDLALARSTGLQQRSKHAQCKVRAPAGQVSRQHRRIERFTARFGEEAILKGRALR